ncbi:DUF72 domain-containing protein [Blastococcus sp. Marseille-P5729]|uniref:DUF72 domain-containing protein n=1 Tax=Blastococcus sp. Marseille-P5729 TaxID=2086582 RepID=UPI000D0EF104|nr:DUF72 domain-containing protein [Blastococcus sp. Marseille-P5729]
MTVLLGTSGWTYDSWTGPFYPAELPARRKLEYYAQTFATVELNASYYRWPKDATFTGWRERLPEGFELTVKAPKSLTHNKKLREPERWAEIITRCMELLGDRRGPLLLQLPPNLGRDDGRLAYALSRFPDWLRIAVEFRHDSWLHEDVFALLQEHQAAYVVMSGAKLPCELKVTTDFGYVRWHGPDHEHLYGGSYSDADLRWWAERIHEWESGGVKVYGYFNNDMNGYAVENAQRLRSYLY